MWWSKHAFFTAFLVIAFVFGISLGAGATQIVNGSFEDTSEPSIVGWSSPQIGGFFHQYPTQWGGTYTYPNCAGLGQSTEWATDGLYSLHLTANLDVVGQWWCVGNEYGWCWIPSGCGVTDSTRVEYGVYTRSLPVTLPANALTLDFDWYVPSESAGLPTILVGDLGSDIWGNLMWHSLGYPPASTGSPGAAGSETIDISPYAGMDNFIVNIYFTVYVVTPSLSSNAYDDPPDPWTLTASGECYIDNVHITTAGDVVVPEPNTLWLLGFFVLGIGAFAMRPLFLKVEQMEG